MLLSAVENIPALIMEIKYHIVKTVADLLDEIEDETESVFTCVGYSGQAYPCKLSC